MSQGSKRTTKAKNQQPQQSRGGPQVRASSGVIFVQSDRALSKPKGLQKEEIIGGPKLLGTKEKSPNKAHQRKDASAQVRE